ncbi:MAG: MarR family transcriptional regulator [Acidimicrobiales bacterium]
MAMNREPPKLRFDPIAEARRQWEAHGWRDAAPGVAAVTSIMRAQQVFQARVDEALRPFALTFARYELLMVLSFSREGAMPLSKLGDRLQVHPTSITNAVDRLEAQGLIRRRPHESDRRMTIAELLPEGRERAKGATTALNAAVFEEPGLGRGDLEKLFELLRDLRIAVGDFAPESTLTNL